MSKPFLLHAGLVILLGVLFFILPTYHAGNLARIMVLAVYAMGYNFLFGYTGLLSLGHALFFAAGMYGLGISMTIYGLSAAPAFIVALIFSLAVSVLIGFLALRTSGVAFMIVTLMFAQVGYLVILYFGRVTRGDEGFIIPQPDRMIAGIDLSNDMNRYYAAFILFTVVYLILVKLIAWPFGKTLIAIRENEDRTRMLGYDTVAHKLRAIMVSGTVAGAAGAAYALLFGYVGATFATTQYSIFPLLWVLLGGAGTTIGPIIGAVFMFYLIDISSSVTTAYMLLAGLVLVSLAVFAPHGIVGTIRKRFAPWIP